MYTLLVTTLFKNVMASSLVWLSANYWPCLLYYVVSTIWVYPAHILLSGLHPIAQLQLPSTHLAGTVGPIRDFTYTNCF